MFIQNVPTAVCFEDISIFKTGFSSIRIGDLLVLLSECLLSSIEMVYRRLDLFNQISNELYLSRKR